jgi:hypothetical protein
VFAHARNFSGASFAPVAGIPVHQRVDVVAEAVQARGDVAEDDRCFWPMKYIGFISRSSSGISLSRPALAVPLVSFPRL